MPWKDKGLSQSQLEAYERLAHATGLTHEELDAEWERRQQKTEIPLFINGDPSRKVHPSHVLKAR